MPVLFCSFFCVTILLWCNSLTSHLKYTVQCFLIYSQNSATISTVNFRKFLSHSKETLFPLKITILHKRILFSGQIPMNNASHCLILLKCAIRYTLKKVYGASPKAIEFGLCRVKENFINLCSLIKSLSSYSSISEFPNQLNTPSKCNHLNPSQI